MSPRAKPAKRPPRRISFARAIEASVDGEAPEACRLWRAGWNKTDKGDLNFTPTSAKLVLKAFKERGNPLAFYYEHEDRLPLEQRGGSPMRGVCSAPASALAARDSDEGPELWAEHIEWTAEARRQIVTGERRQISPIAAFDEETREIVEILNVSLCAEGATHHGTILASKGGKATSMDELMEKLLAAIEAKDWELAETLINEIEAADGGAMLAKMAKAYVKNAKDGAEEEPPKPEPEVATRRLAATRAPVVSESFARVEAEMRTATQAARDAAKRSDRATVRVLIAASRTHFDAVDEREHVAAADPEATAKFIASMDRKAKAGVLVAGKGAEGTKPPTPPKPGADETFGLTPMEIQTAGQHGVSLEAFAKSKARTGAQPQTRKEA